MRLCRKCGTVLTEGNTYPSQWQKHSNICTTCACKEAKRRYDKQKTTDPEFLRKIREKSRRWRTENRERFNELVRNYMRQHLIRVKGKWMSITKRQCPEKCEICKRKRAYRLGYHHWDDNNPSKGLWLCIRCHRIAEALDHPEKVVNKYLALKQEIESRL